MNTYAVLFLPTGLAYLRAPDVCECLFVSSFFLVRYSREFMGGASLTLLCIDATTTTGKTTKSKCQSYITPGVTLNYATICLSVCLFVCLAKNSMIKTTISPACLIFCHIILKHEKLNEVLLMEVPGVALKMITQKLKCIP